MPANRIHLAAFTAWAEWIGGSASCCNVSFSLSCQHITHTT